MINTNFVFRSGRLTFLMDGGAGSSGKGKLGSFITEHADNWQFACNAFSAQAGHWCRLDDGREFFYQHLNSCAYNRDRYEKMYIGQAACIELPALLREIEENGVNEEKLGIDPLASIILERDSKFEKGVSAFDSDESLSERHDGTSKNGSTNHGCGSCLARKVLRRPSVLLVKDVPELKPFICNVPEEIMARLCRGQSGLCEIAQGFQLSLPDI